MITKIPFYNHQYKIDLSKPLDLSIPISGSEKNITAWYLDAPSITPVVDKNWIGKVSEGAATNFNTIVFNPHSHGTHTECIGHITSEFKSINKTLTHFFFLAEVITITPRQQGEDYVIDVDQIKNAISSKENNALIIRTLPNTANKIHKQYSNTNWPYLTQEAAIYIRNQDIEHLLIDLPSIDKEKDEGKLLAHKAFWNYPEAPRDQATITEMIYVDNAVKDGLYVLNLQIAAFENDATPSKPILYKIL